MSTTKNKKRLKSSLPCPTRAKSALTSLTLLRALWTPPVCSNSARNGTRETSKQKDLAGARLTFPCGQRSFSRCCRCSCSYP